MAQVTWKIDGKMTKLVVERLSFPSNNSVDVLSRQIKLESGQYLLEQANAVRAGLDNHAPTFGARL